MNLVKAAAAALNQTPFAWQANKENILRAIDEARAAEVGILVLPELGITGYGCEDQFLSPGLQRTALAVLEEIVPQTAGIIVCLGLPIFFQNALFDAVCLAANGNILGFAAKQFLAGDGIHYEPRWFKAWPPGGIGEIRLSGRDYPLGDLLFDFGELKLGFEICEDAWAANRPGADLASRGANIILNPSASHFAFGKNEIRKRFVLEGSRAFGVGYVYASLLGNEAGRVIYDGCTLVAAAGELLAEGPRFSFGDVVLTSALIDLDDLRREKAKVASFEPRIAASGKGTISADFSPPVCRPAALGKERDAWEQSAQLKEEEFTRAVALGLFDYLRKSRAYGYVVSLSGGADSSGVCCLVALLVRLGLLTLGREGFVRKLSYIPALQEAKDERGIVNVLLCCVYQATRNSSETTRSAARTVAETLGARYLELEIDKLVEAYTELISQGLKRRVSWEDDDLALQNIQARVRGPGVWFIANLERALLLATSNRSEAAVGYATMDGDTCGGLSPIAGIDKAFLLEWLRWLAVSGPIGLRPIPELAAVTAQEPTAELRPLGLGQKDEQDLMPYKILDAIERLAIRDKLTPLEVYQQLSVQCRDYSGEQLGLWIERFFKLWCRNQWKRERFAPSFHLDDENLDPKTWCRFPILSGSFARELAELREYLAVRA